MVRGSDRFSEHGVTRCGFTDFFFRYRRLPTCPPLIFCDDASRREHQHFIGDKAGRQGLLRVLREGLGSASTICEAGNTETAGADRVHVVNWEGYRKIDRDEVARGATKGKPREKLVDISQMLKIAGADSGQ